MKGYAVFLIANAILCLIAFVFLLRLVIHQPERLWLVASVNGLLGGNAGMSLSRAATILNR